MANKAVVKTVRHSDVAAVDQLMEMGKEQVEAEVRKLKIELEVVGEEREALGVIKGLRADRAYTDLKEAITLYRIKESKTYKRLGFPWARFCELAGYEVRTADRLISEINPIFEAFSANLSNLFGLKLNEIRMLGSAISDNIVQIEGDNIRYKDQLIPMSEVQTVLDDLKDEIQQAREERKADKQASERYQADMQKQLQKLHGHCDTLEKKLRKEIPKTDLSEEEADGIEMLKALQLDFMGWLSTIRTKISYADSPEIVLRSLYFLLLFIGKAVADERMKLNDVYENAEECPWEIVEEDLPPAEAMVDNLPASRGMGQALAKKIQEKAKTK